MKVTQIPYKPPRKARKQESLRFVVKWVIGDTMHFQAFKRDSAACAFLNTIVASGYDARILMS
jgi:hypothetical protein